MSSHPNNTNINSGYASLDTSAYEAFARVTWQSAALGSVVGHIALIIIPLALVGVFDESGRRELKMTALTATSRSFDVSLKRPRPKNIEKSDKSNKQKPAEGANVKHVSRFNSDIVREHTNSIQNSIVYPRMARKLGMQGRVKIRAVIGPDGHVTEATIIQGTGFGILDESALNDVRSHRFTPGDKIETVIIRLRFKLTKNEN